MNKLQNFTSTGGKLLHHTNVVQKLSESRMAMPVSLQVAPTSRCQLKCVFCSNVNRDKHEDLDPDLLMSFIFRMEWFGLKTVEWTGGGDPLMYKHLESMIHYCADMGLQQGLITNGKLLAKRSSDILNKLHWIRVSMNTLDYQESLSLPVIKGTLGFSYVMNEKTNQSILYALSQHVRRYRPAYVRIVPNCQLTHYEQEMNNKTYGSMVASWGDPYFYQPKTFNTPKHCYWGYFKPFLLHDGWVYPCSSVVLNDEAERSFHAKYRWEKAEVFEVVYKNKIAPFRTDQCDSCVFSAQNDQIESILNPTGHENFV